MDKTGLGFRDFISLKDPVWSVLHIAMHLGVKESVVLRAVNKPGFPKPIVNERRNRRWLASDVVDYFARKSKGELVEVTAPKINPAYEPKVISYKNMQSRSHNA